ncbi:endolytic transglycosylase MltG [Aureimonas glaciei]|uniref:Endolytic murein transglycosylase n=1 Tax=Aureimonas glaciei TaxID=1776957 RepID=A0A916XW64_9HYPH|nr:endolytic transglycosylase MltG [Aureimonas glaciei]GGD14482.1 4-amino-4-deoxychorismate lyase [Aureimonas glaciei]
MTEESGDRRDQRLVPQSAAEALRPRPAPKPPRRSRGARNQVVVFFNLIFSVALLVALVAVGVVAWGRAEFYGAGPLTTQASYVIPRNSGLETIARGLEREGIISNSSVFEYGVRLSSADGDLKAGEYGFEPGASMRDVMDKIRSGQSILHSVAVPEGWTVRQVYDRLQAEPVLTGDLPPLVPEGTLRTDTYRVQRGMTRAELVAKMQASQTALVEEVWARRDKDIDIKDIGEFVTLASIVEKETGRADERSRVAAVFLNRLKKGMRLQSDPTIIYGIWGGSGKPPSEPIRQSHIKDANPYNTYVINGLPPGPIANPGRAALEAVANPSETQDVYFVADGTGGHIFAKTLDEHNANVRRYRAIERAQNAAAAAGGAPADAEPDDPVAQ